MPPWTVELHPGCLAVSNGTMKSRIYGLEVCLRIPVHVPDMDDLCEKMPAYESEKTTENHIPEA